MVLLKELVVEEVSVYDIIDMESILKTIRLIRLLLTSLLKSYINISPHYLPMIYKYWRHE